ncbi:uncharacterized protein N7500_008765 [Penicillium coprophilum]|uniref:uncharacterized protein n=1 Tax=Penicillium coprophilum TaxID=36646 RepID=UPI002393621F|nr:uncharacterized protein N7500_008765 [Penicillium coprophilum]KAJ5159114.1 hypothetical protein N7500_008765 [Penicillium coprophilum]
METINLEFQEPTAGPGQKQPWREWWPPRQIESMSEEERKAQPWIAWKPDPAKPNAKPWLGWVPRKICRRNGDGQDQSPSSGAEGG